MLLLRHRIAVGDVDEARRSTFHRHAGTVLTVEVGAPALDMLQLVAGRAARGDVAVHVADVAVAVMLAGRVVAVVLVVGADDIVACFHVLSWVQCWTLALTARTSLARGGMRIVLMQLSSLLEKM